MHLQEATLASKTRTVVAIEELERLVPVLKVGTLQLGPAVKVTHTQCCIRLLCSLAVPREPAQMAQSSRTGMVARQCLCAVTLQGCQLEPTTDVG